MLYPAVTLIARFLLKHPEAAPSQGRGAGGGCVGWKEGWVGLIAQNRGRVLLCLLGGGELLFEKLALLGLKSR